MRWPLRIALALSLVSVAVPSVAAPTPVPVSQDRFVRTEFNFFSSLVEEVIATDFGPFSAAVDNPGFPFGAFEMDAIQTSSLPGDGATGDLFARSFKPDGDELGGVTDTPATSSFVYDFDVNEAGGYYDLELSLLYVDYSHPTPHGGQVTLRGTGFVRLERLAPNPQVLVERTAGCMRGCLEEGNLPAGSYRLSVLAEVAHIPTFEAPGELEWSVHALFTFRVTDPPPPPSAPALPYPALASLALLFLAAGVFATRRLD